MGVKWWIAAIYNLLMRNNSIWFDSPLPKLPAANALQRDLANDPEDSHFPKQPPESPRQLPDSPEVHPPARDHSAHPLSPWSFLVNSDQDHKSTHLALPGLFPSRPQEVIEERLVYSEEEEEELLTPQRNDSPCGESEEEGELLTTGRKSQLDHRHRIRKSRPRDKGLRKLSEKAFEIVRDMRNATYKDVASRLLHEISQEEFEGEGREEQNIKRRVYDALNVLIALGVLKKDGRKIISEKDLSPAAPQDTASDEIDKLNHKIAERQTVLDRKQKQLWEIEEKYRSINSLICRNQQAKRHNQTIAFPFIGLMVHQSQQKQSKRNTQTEVTIRTGSKLQPFGDIDSLKWLLKFPKQEGEELQGSASSFL